MKRFRAFIEEDRVRVFDGAMGTMLYNKGVYINRCYDELISPHPIWYWKYTGNMSKLAPISLRPTLMVHRV